MRRIIMTLLLALGVSNASAENYFSNGKVNAEDKFLSEFEAIQRDLQSGNTAQFPKHRYCVRCTSGEKLNCDVPFGGEVGRAMCGAYGVKKCRSGGGQVDFNGCP